MAYLHTISLSSTILPEHKCKLCVLLMCMHVLYMFGKFVHAYMQLCVVHVFTYLQVYFEDTVLHVLLGSIVLSYGFHVHGACMCVSLMAVRYMRISH